MRRTEQKIGASRDAVLAAAHTLILKVRMMEGSEKARSKGATMELEVELESGEFETWTIEIKRKASTHYGPHLRQ